jgi:hypothetical protein
MYTRWPGEGRGVWFNPGAVVFSSGVLLESVPLFPCHLLDVPL